MGQRGRMRSTGRIVGIVSTHYPGIIPGDGVNIMTTSSTINKSTLAFWQNVYTTALIHGPDHLVLVARVGEYSGLWSADRFIAEMGTTVQKSNSSSMNTLATAILETVPTAATDDEDLQRLVDGIAADIFGEGPVEWSTLRRLISADGVVKRNSGKDDFNVIEYASRVLATRQGFIAERRDYYGEQTDEMFCAIVEAGYGDLLTDKAQGRAGEAVVGVKPDGPIVAEPTDPDKGIWEAIAIINRVMTGDRKCHKVAFFVQEMVKAVGNFETFEVALDSAGLVETTV
jgi:hypothetical protein